MQTLSYGFKKPETSDTGTPVFEAMEDNFQQLNDHSHDGSDSAKLTSASVTPSTGSASSGSWGSDLGGGTYRQLVTLPAGLTFDACVVHARNSADGSYIAARIIKNNATTFYVYTNDPSLTYSLVYLT